jgi:hypothetical protein
VDRCSPENSTYKAFQHFVVDSQLFGLRKSSDAVAAVAATAAIAFSSFSVFCQFVFFHLQNKLQLTNKTNKTKMHRAQMAKTPGPPLHQPRHTLLTVTSLSLSPFGSVLLFFNLFSLPSGVAAARTINTATVVDFSPSLLFLLLFFFLLQIFFSLFLLRKNTPAMNEDAKGHKCVCYYWFSARLQCLLAVTETEREREAGERETQRERERERRGA